MKGRALLGKKWSAGRLRRYREGVARRKAAGLYEGRLDPRTEVLTIKCSNPECGKDFPFTFSPRISRTKKRFCTHACQLRANHDLRTRVPEADELREMYKTMTCAEIGKILNMTGGAIRYALIRYGIPRRKAGGRTKAEKCKATSGQ